MRTSFHRFLLLLSTLFWLMPDARAQENGGVQLTTRQFLADTAAVEPGKPFYVGFHFKIVKGYHMYWRFAGTVEKPFEIASWNLPPGWEAAPVGFPLPTMIFAGEHAEEGFSLDKDPAAEPPEKPKTKTPSFVYNDEVMFLAKITPPKDFKAGEVEIGATASWQVCNPKSCIPFTETVKLKLAAGTVKPANAELFKTWLGQIPRTDDPPTTDVKFAFADQKLAVHIGGLPKDTTAEFFPIPPPRYSGTITDKESYKAETTPEGARVMTYPFDADLGWSGLLVTKGPDGVRKGWYIGDPPEIALTEPVAGATRGGAGAAASGPKWPLFAEVEAARKLEKVPDGQLWLLLLEGFLGGLLLNVMPCVLPVISLKIFGFVQQAGHARERIFKLGLAFCAGIFAFFLGLAVLVLALASAKKDLGWGAQFSHPIGLTIMVSIMFLFGLSLLGVFEITLGGKTSSKLSELSGKEGFGGSFVHGFLTTLLGTSCTAPLVGPVLGTAINQPGPRIFALFGAIALGLALPYFLLTWQPAWMKFLPKPGTWMVRFKQVLGFAMLGFCVWFLASFPSTTMLVAVAWFLLVLGLAAWLYGSYHDSWWPTPVSLAMIAAGWWVFIRPDVNLPVVENSGLEAKVGKALEEGRPVFVDFTASWCQNCRVWEGLVLHTDPVQKALKDKNVLVVTADYTLQPADLADALRKMGRVGVPAYILFRRRGEGPLKPEDFTIFDLPSSDTLIGEVNKL